MTEEQGGVQPSREENTRKQKATATARLDAIGTYDRIRRGGLVLGLIGDVVATCFLGLVSCFGKAELGEMFIFLFLPVLLLFGSQLIAWRWVRAGGLLVLFEGIYITTAYLVIYTPGWSPGLTVIMLGLLGLPLLFSGVLFTWSGIYLNKRSGTDRT